PACVQPFVTTGLLHVTCPGAAAGFVRGLICAVLAGVAFFGGLACFFWAAHLRSLHQMMRIRQSPPGGGAGLFGCGPAPGCTDRHGLLLPGRRPPGASKAMSHGMILIGRRVDLEDATYRVV